VVNDSSRCLQPIVSIHQACRCWVAHRASALLLDASRVQNKRGAITGTIEIDHHRAPYARKQIISVPLNLLSARTAGKIDRMKDPHFLRGRNHTTHIIIALIHAAAYHARVCVSLFLHRPYNPKTYGHVLV
jgi:hypothetical protein